MHCWNCGANLPDVERNKISYRATCDHCHSYLHCCKNCKNYKPGLPNDCMVPGTDYIADRAGANFCDEFSLLGVPPKKGEDKKRFDDLFK